MTVTATEFKANVGRYLRLARQQDIFVTRNGRTIAKVTDPVTDKQTILDRFAGIGAHNPVTLEEARDERLSRQ